MRLSAGTPLAPRCKLGRHGAPISRCSPPMREKVELCLFDSQGRRELERIELPERTEDVWHGYLNDVSPGQLYGYRVHGPYEPEHGHRFNPNKLLLDPYAQAARRTAGVERRAFRLSHRQRARGSLLRPARQCARHAEGRRRRRGLQLGPPRNAPQHPLGRHHHLRGARQGADAEARRRAAEPARHLRRPVVAAR